jgi:DNA-binding GntR family transcriptional regulator
MRNKEGYVAASPRYQQIADDDKEQEFLKLADNHTVIEVCRTSFAEDETPIRVTVTVYPSDLNQIAYNVGSVPDHREEPVQS